MLTSSELKTQLREFSQTTDRIPPSGELPRLLEAMTTHLGSPDPELRDELIYFTFAKWIPKDVLSTAQLKQLLTTVLDEQHLFYRIGENGTDSVFTRSFSVLLLPLIVYAHLRHPYLSTAEIFKIKTGLLQYVRDEKDRRGYVEPQGWAHTVAHTADAIDELAKCRELNAADLRDLLGAISVLLNEPRQVYAFEEDERLSVASVTIFRRQLLEPADWETWLESLFSLTRETRPTLQAHHLRINIKHFLRSFYFRLRRPENAEVLDQAMLDSMVSKLEGILQQLVCF